MNELPTSKCRWMKVLASLTAATHRTSAGLGEQLGTAPSPQENLNGPIPRRQHPAALGRSPVRRMTPDRPTRERLRRTVRAAAAAAHGETVFVKRVRAAGVVLRPRYAGGDTQHVVGYAVRACRDGIETGPWVGGSGDLSLATLRAHHWRDSPSGRLVALSVWNGTSTPGTTWSVSQPTDADIARWWKAAANATQWRHVMAEIPVTDHLLWTRWSRQIAGLLAAWSEVLEGDQPGRFAAALREMTRYQRRPNPSDYYGPSLATHPNLPGRLARMLLDHSLQVQEHDPRRTGGEGAIPRSPLLAALFVLLSATIAALKELERAHRARNELGSGMSAWFAAILLEHVRRDWEAKLHSPQFPWDAETFETFFAAAGMTHLLRPGWRS